MERPSYQTLLKSPLVRFLILAAAILAGASGLKFYLIDYPKMQAAEIAQSGPETLELLSQKIAEVKDPKNLPESTHWNPSDLPCASSKLPHTDDFWSMVGLDTKKPSVYQFRFDKSDGIYTLWARRDSDCDGLYVVHRIDASLGAAGTPKSHNLGE